MARVLDPESRVRNPGSWLHFAPFASFSFFSRSIITLTRLLRPFYELLKKCWEHVAPVAAIPPGFHPQSTSSLSFFSASQPTPFAFVFACRSFYLFLLLVFAC